MFVVNEYKIYADEKGNIIEEPNITFGKYEIVFDVNGGNAQEIEGLVHEIINSNTVLTNAAPTRTGYTFMGWYDGTDYTKSNMYFDAQQKICNIGIETSEDNPLVLYAGWKPIEYTVTYHSNELT